MIPNSAEKPGYLMPEPENDETYSFTGAPEDYPEEWIETARNGIVRLRSDRRPYAAKELTVDATGTVGTTGRRAWFLPGKFRLCPACGDQPPVQAREINKVASLSAEGRSSATTLLVSSALRWMNTTPAPCRSSGASCSASPTIARTQHSRPAISTTSCSSLCCAPQRSRRCERQGPRGFRRTSSGDVCKRMLGFKAAKRERRKEWMLDPEVRGVGQVEAERTLARVLAHRAWVDQRRGWRFTNPNLEELGLVRG